MSHSPLDVVIVSGVRTPYSKFGGQLKEVPSVDLGAQVLNAVVNRVNVSPRDIQEIFYGVCVPAETGVLAPVVARQALLKAGFPPETVSISLDRACCSSLSAVQMAYRSIRSGEIHTAIAAGADNLSRTPYIIPELRWGSRIGAVTLQDPIAPMGYRQTGPVAVDAGSVASEYEVTREEQDRWALQSQQRYAAAKAEGFFDAEIVPVEIPQRRGPALVFSQDEFPKPDTTLEGLAKLATVYDSETVTPGNAPGLDAGASALLLMTRAEAEQRGLTPIATIVSAASVALEPRYLASVPAPAIRKALELANLSLDDMKLIEINEAFAAMPLVSAKVLAEGDKAKEQAILEKTNVNGGAIAIGHPIGASGARILMTLAYGLKRRGGGYGVASICGGLAQGDAVLIRVEG